MSCNYDQLVCGTGCMPINSVCCGTYYCDPGKFCGASNFTCADTQQPVANPQASSAGLSMPVIVAIVAGITLLIIALLWYLFARFLKKDDREAERLRREAHQQLDEEERMREDRRRRQEAHERRYGRPRKNADSPAGSNHSRAKLLATKNTPSPSPLTPETALSPGGPSMAQSHQPQMQGSAGPMMQYPAAAHMMHRSQSVPVEQLRPQPLAYHPPQQAVMYQQPPPIFAPQQVQPPPQQMYAPPQQQLFAPPRNPPPPLQIHQQPQPYEVPPMAHVLQHSASMPVYTASASPLPTSPIVPKAQPTSPTASAVVATGAQIVLLP